MARWGLGRSVGLRRFGGFCARRYGSRDFGAAGLGGRLVVGWSRGRGVDFGTDSFDKVLLEVSFG